MKGEGRGLWQRMGPRWLLRSAAVVAGAAATAPLLDGTAIVRTGVVGAT